MKRRFSSPCKKVAAALLSMAMVVQPVAAGFSLGSVYAATGDTVIFKDVGYGLSESVNGSGMGYPASYSELVCEGESEAFSFVAKDYLVKIGAFTNTEKYGALAANNESLNSTYTASEGFTEGGFTVNEKWQIPSKKNNCIAIIRPEGQVSMTATGKGVLTANVCTVMKKVGSESFEQSADVVLKGPDGIVAEKDGKVSFSSGSDGKAVTTLNYEIPKAGTYTFGYPEGGTNEGTIRIISLDYKEDNLSGTPSPTTGGIKPQGDGKTVIYDITKDGKTFEGFTVDGNLNSKDETSAEYDGKTYTGKGLKFESSTTIDFAAASKAKLVLVLDSGFTGSEKIDGNKVSAQNGIITVDVAAGEHRITKGDSAKLYAIYLIYEEGSQSGGATAAPSATATGGATAAPSATAIGGATAAPSATATGGATGTPAVSATDGVTGTPAVSATDGVTGTPAVSATDGVTGTPAVPPTDGVTGTPAVPPTGGVTGTPAVPPTGGVTVTPAASPSAVPSKVPTMPAVPTDEPDTELISKSFVLKASEFNKEVMGIEGKIDTSIDIEDGTEYNIYSFNGAKVPGSTQGQIGLKKGKGFIILKAPNYGTLTISVRSAGEGTSYLSVIDSYNSVIEPLRGSEVISGKEVRTLTYDIPDAGKYKIGYKTGVLSEEIRFTELAFDTQVEGGNEGGQDKPIVSDVTSFEAKDYLETNLGIKEKTEVSMTLENFDYGMYSFYSPIVPSKTNDTLALAATTGYVNFNVFGKGKLTIWARSAGADRTAYMNVRSIEDGSFVSEVNGKSDEKGVITISGNQEQAFVFNIEKAGGYNIGYAKKGCDQIRFYAISFERDAVAVPGEDEEPTETPTAVPTEIPAGTLVPVTTQIPVATVNPTETPTEVPAATTAPTAVAEATLIPTAAVGPTAAPEQTVSYTDVTLDVPFIALPKNVQGISFTVSKNDAGKIVAGKAKIQMKKPVINGEMVSILKEMSDGAPVDITVESVKKGNVLNRVTVNTKDVIAGTKLAVYEVKADGSLGLTNGKNVKISAKGDLKVKIKGAGSYVLLNVLDADKAHQEIEDSVRFVSDNIVVTAGGKRKLAFADGFSMENVKKMKFSVAEKNVVQVDKNGVLIGISEGTAIVKVSAVLVDGSCVEDRVAVICRP